VRRTQHVLVWPRGGPDAPRADGDHGWGAPAGTAGDGALRVRVPRARAAVEAWVAGGGPRGGSARTGSRRSPRCLTAPLSRGVRRDGAAVQLRRARRAGGPPGGCRRRLALSFETSLTGEKVKGHRPAGRHEVNARTPPPLAYKNSLVLASNTFLFGWSGAAAPTTRSSDPSRRERCAKSSRPAGRP